MVAEPDARGDRGQHGGAPGPAVRPGLTRRTRCFGGRFPAPGGERDQQDAAEGDGRADQVHGARAFAEHHQADSPATSDQQETNGTAIVRSLRAKA